MKRGTVRAASFAGLPGDDRKGELFHLRSGNVVDATMFLLDQQPLTKRMCRVAVRNSRPLAHSRFEMGFANRYGSA